MKEIAMQILISILVGGPLGLSIYNLIYRDGDKKIGFGDVIGAVSGSFLGSFALLLMSLIIEKLRYFPENYYSTVIGAAIFTVGMLKFIAESIEKE